MLVTIYIYTYISYMINVGLPASHSWALPFPLYRTPGESCHTYEWVMSHVWISHVTRVNKSCQTCKWVMSHVWMSHVTCMDESCVSELSELHHWDETWLNYMCAMTQWYVCHDSFICVPWLIYMRAMTHSSESGLPASHHRHVTWLVHMCVMTHSYVCHDSFKCVPWLTRVRATCLHRIIDRWRDS